MKRSIELKVEVMSRKKYIGIMLGASSALILCAIASLGAPEILEEKTFNMYSIDIAKINIGVDLKNQFIALTSKPTETSEEEAQIDIKLIGIKDSTETVLIDDKVVYPINCQNGKCQEFLVFYQPFIRYDNYTVELIYEEPLNGGSFTLKYVNQAFTVFQIAVKAVLFVFSLASLVVLIISLRKVQWSDMCFESKMVVFLSVSLCLFNDPYFALSIFMPSEFTTILSVFNSTQFIMVLLIFWIILFQHYDTVKYKSLFLVLEASLVVVTYVLIFVIYLYVHLQFKNKPHYNWKEDFDKTLKGSFIALIVMLVMIGLIFLLLVIVSFCNYRNMTSRGRMLCCINFAMIFLTFVGIGVGGFLVLPTNSVLMVCFLTAFNLYVYMLAYFYSPSKVSLLYEEQAPATDQQFEPIDEKNRNK